MTLLVKAQTGRRLTIESDFLTGRYTAGFETLRIEQDRNDFVLHRKFKPYPVLGFTYLCFSGLFTNKRIFGFFFSRIQTGLNR